MTRNWRWFDSIASRTILLLLIGVGVVHLASLYAYQHALEREASHAGETRLADRMLNIRSAVMRLAPHEREPVAHELSGGLIEAHWSATDKAAPGGAGAQHWEGLRQQLQALAPDLTPAEIMIGASDMHLALVSLRIPDGSWLNVTAFASLPRTQGSHDPGGHGTVLSTSLMALGVVLVSIVVVGWLTKPLRRFAELAQQLYRGTEQVPVPDVGPREVRELANAFNEMQARIGKLIEDRTQTLAAVSHDLKTPLTRLRLRCEGMDDKALAVGITADIREMEHMLDQTLVHLKGERGDEALRPVDLVSMLQTLIDDAADAGATARLEAPDSLVLPGRSLALKRAFSNLIENALKYASGVEVRVTRETESARITFRDSGPGIPEASQSTVFEPFVRLETSRSKETGGFGLGLSIARAAIEAHGGTIRLANRAQGGLEVSVSLPCNASEAP